ncbi:hypothetical protein BH24CHL4_BH24CHL4_25290 [soil metagenome]
MNTRRLVWLAIILSMTAFTPSIDQSGNAQESRDSRSCGSLAVATAPLTPGSPLVSNQVVLTRPDGTPMMSAPFTQPARVWPASFEGRALVRSLGSDYGVFDLETKTITLLEFPGSEPGAIDPNTVQFIESHGQRFHLLGDAAKVSGYLIDLQLGMSLSLQDLLEAPELIVSGVVSANDHWLAFSTSSQLYLVDLTSIGPAVAIEADLRTGNPIFTTDGKSLIYLRESGPQRSDLVLWDLETDARRVIAPAAGWFGARMFPGDILIAYQEGSLVRIPLDGGDPQTIVESPGTLEPVSIDTSGVTLLVRQNTGNETSWFLATLDGSTITKLESLNGLRILTPNAQANWALFTINDTTGPGAPGVPYVSLDLQRGTTATLLTQDSAAVYAPGIDSAADGQYHLVQSIDREHGRLWLIDGAAESGTLVAEYPGNVIGALSPGGCYLAVSTFAALGEGRQGQVEIRDLLSGEVTATVSDAVALGWVRL